MTMVTVDDVLSDPELRDAVSEELVSALEAARAKAQTLHQDTRERRDGYTLVVSEHGDIDVEIDAFNGFDNWVDEAQDLALHVGPSTDPNTGARVYELLGRDADGEPVDVKPRADDHPEAAETPEDGPGWGAGLPPLHWPGWSPRLAAPPGQPAPDLTVDVERVVWAWRCDGCGAASLDEEDFERIAGDREHRSCDCGAQAERTPAVFCESCDTLILLRNTDPGA